MATTAKRVQACIDLRLPDTGDEEIDSLIRKARRQEAAISFVSAVISNPSIASLQGNGGEQAFAEIAVRCTGILLEELDKKE